MNIPVVIFFIIFAVLFFAAIYYFVECAKYVSKTKTNLHGEDSFYGIIGLTLAVTGIMMLFIAFDSSNKMLVKDERVPVGSCIINPFCQPAQIIPEDWSYRLLTDSHTAREFTKGNLTLHKQIHAPILNKKNTTIHYKLFDDHGNEWPIIMQKTTSVFPH